MITPEITYLPGGMGNMANAMSAKAGGMADVSASLVSALFDLGADVHVALPHYRRMFNIDVGRLISRELRMYKKKLTRARIHLAEDRVFYYRDNVYDGYAPDDSKFALVFQREVINNIIPRVAPDLIHCNDWMTGLIPAMARRMGIPCLFTVHNIHTYELTLERIEDSGIDAAEFWSALFYKWPGGSYEDVRNSNPVDLLASGIFAAHYINTVSPTFLEEIVDGHHVIPANIRHEVSQKKLAGCAAGILNAPDQSYDPSNDSAISTNYSSHDHVAGKLANKEDLQSRLSLEENLHAPLFFWPSRLDPVQKGPELLVDILYNIVSDYWDEGLQVLFVANGVYQQHFHNIVSFYNLFGRVAVCDFDEELSRRGYAGSDFTLMPSLFEPCGLPQMVGSIYGSLPIVHDTGGLHDTVSHIDLGNGTGNGFVFETYDSGGLRWAVDRAMEFYRQPEDVKERYMARIMNQSRDSFNHEVTARRYFDVYEEMLHRPLVKD